MTNHLLTRDVKKSSLNAIAFILRGLGKVYNYIVEYMGPEFKIASNHLKLVMLRILVSTFLHLC